MEKNLFAKLMKTLLPVVMLLFITMNSLAQNQRRYIKEISATSQTITYELFDVDYYRSTNNFSDAQLLARYSIKPGFVSITRDAARQVFYLELNRNFAESIIKSTVFNFNEIELKRLPQNPVVPNPNQH